jgi:8-oxo-dGTP pyrophosphatase MutT (NUDIX family)
MCAQAAPTPSTTAAAARDLPDNRCMSAPPVHLTPEVLRQRLAAFAVQAIEPAGRRHAAVAVAVTEAGFGADVQGTPVHAQWSDATALLLTRRAATLSAHAGQWAMPGGRIDDGESPEAAALRELLEEIGLSLPSDAICGRLDDYATRSGYVITPVVVWAGPARELVPNPAEVASIHRIPASELLRNDAPLLNHVKGAEHPVLRMPVGERWIAAPTAAFIYQFREWCLLERDTRVAHFDQPYFAWR